MIILFHFVFLITKYVINTLSKSLCETKDITNVDTESVCTNDPPSTVVQQESFTSESKYVNGNLKFFPPVYIQRYEAVCLILQEPPWKDTIKKVVDFGCSQLSFFLYLKHIPGLEEILEVDIDENVLRDSASKAAPFNSDYILSKRSKPLAVYLLAGSISDYDDRLVGTDAVVAIEVIEHLNPDVLQKVPYNIFHEIRPKLAIFTTPNADFNTLFPNILGFRHLDHKFEWSRKEFYKWTREITKTYPEYSVKFYGIGVGPEGTENLGCCTQMAVFERHEESEVTVEPRGINNYKLIERFDYPFYTDTRTDEEKTLDEVIYRVKFSLDLTYYHCEDGISEIPLSQFMDYIKQWCHSEDQLKKILLDYGFHVQEKDGQNLLFYCSHHSDDIDYVEEENSVELNIDEPFSKTDYVSEMWDLEDEVNTDPVIPDDSIEEEMPNFLSARSLKEIGDLHCSDISKSGIQYPEKIGDGLQCVFTTQTSDRKFENKTFSRIPRKKLGAGLRNISKSAKSLVRPSSVPDLKKCYI